MTVTQGSAACAGRNNGLIAEKVEITCHENDAMNVKRRKFKSDFLNFLP